MKQLKISQHIYQKGTPAQVFSYELCKELVWTAASDLGKYLKILAITIAFAEYIWIFWRLKQFENPGIPLNLKNLEKPAIWKWCLKNMKIFWLGTWKK